MGEEPGPSYGPRNEDDDDEDEEEYEEASGGNRLLGFMFGNVDGAGDLDVDYLDEDAKEHLAALAEKLGSSLTDISLSIKSSQPHADASEQDYDEKAEDAVDYEDIDEQYEGPEIQATFEEDHLLPKAAYFPAEISLAALGQKSSVFDEENYDEDEDLDEEEKVVDDSPEAQTLDSTSNSTMLPAENVNQGCSSTPLDEITGQYQESSPEKAQIVNLGCNSTPLDVITEQNQQFSPEKDDNVQQILEEEKLFEDSLHSPVSSEDDKLAVGLEDFEDEQEGCQESFDEKSTPSLPVLYVEDGMVVLRFSEIFGVHEPVKKGEKKNYRYPILKEKHKTGTACVAVKEDEEAFLRGSYPGSFSTKKVPSVYDYSLAVKVHDKESQTFDAWQGIMTKPGEVFERRKDSCLSGEPMKESVTIDIAAGWRSPSCPKFSPLDQQDWEDDIIWGNSPLADHGSSESCIISGVDSEDLIRETTSEDRPQNSGSGFQIEADEKYHHFLLSSCPIVLESFGSMEPSEANHSISEMKHPQQLRLEAFSKVGDSTNAGRLENGTSQSSWAGAVKNFSKLSLQNMDMLEDSWLEKIIWDPTKAVSKPKLILDLQDERMLFEISETKDFSHLQCHAGAMIITRLVKPNSGNSGDPTCQVGVSAGRFNISNDKYYSNRKNSQQLKSHSKKRAAHGVKVLQSIPALKLQTMKAKLSKYCEERPLLLGNIGMGARLCTYYQKSAPGDQTGSLLRNENSSLGNVLTLDPTDKSPFLGDIRPGCSQSCLETNLYRAPIFRHKLCSTDYLLVRSAKGKLSLRRIDRIDVVGQQEPHMEVISPGTKSLQTYIYNRLLVYIYREFSAIEKRGLLPCVRADELAAQFPTFSEPFIRKRLKHCADLQKGPNGHLFWVMRRNFRIPLEEELRRMVTPENVCTYESMQAGLYRLKRLGISRLTHPTGLSSAMNQLPDEAIALAAASHIERELLITPWNLSSNFVSCTNQDRDNIERLEITGVGDPSGRGMGFSYVRLAPKAPLSSAVVKKKTAIPKGGSTVTGTDADLRRLSMEAAREVLLKFNVPEEQIAKQTRWHRIAMIRKLSSEQAASGVKVDSTTISKYARGQRMSFLQLQQQTREKCQEIWDRQIQSLSAANEDENDSDSEANSDLDSFAGDLENLLDAEECGVDEEGEFESMNEKEDGIKGLKMRRRPSQPQADEEIEDEAAEAAELCRMLMDEDESERRKKKNVASGLVEREVEPGWQSGVEQARKTNTIVKKIVRTSQPDGTVTQQEHIITDPKEVEKILAKRAMSAKAKSKKGSIDKIDVARLGLPKYKSKTTGEAFKVIKEKKPTDKPTRERFLCGACGQMGHMRTNKNCPRYGEDQDTHLDTIDTTDTPRPKSSTKKLNPKSSTKLPIIETSENSKPPPLPLKVVKPSELSQSDKQTRINRIVISNNKVKSEDIQLDPPPPPKLVIRPPVEDREPPRKKIIIKQPKESYEESYRKTKTMSELSRRKEEELVEKIRLNEERRQWEEEEKRRRVDRLVREERERLFQEERIAELRRYEAWQEEQEAEKEKMKKIKLKKKKRKEPEPEPESEVITRSGKRRAAVVEIGKRRRGGAGEVGLANILEGVVESLKEASAISYLFLKPVSKKEAPDYHEIVKQPMDLSTIKEKVRKMEYKDREDFRHDVWQITFNAHQYNDGRNPGIPPLADQLLELCDYFLDQSDEQMAEAEAGIEGRKGFRR